MGFNKGEWSEMYVFLYLLENPNLIIVDENLKIIQKNIFKVLEIILDNKKYKIEDNKIIKIVNNKQDVNFDIKFISNQNKILLENILTCKSSNGSFNIDEINSFIADFFDAKKPKGSSNSKSDLDFIALDKKLNRNINLSYNIKSNLGNKGTLLNASNNTNFIYEISNIDDSIMQRSNEILSSKKLLDRCNFLISNGANIQFYKIQSDIFEYNLKLIDSNLDQFLAQILLLSYKENEKDILKLIKLISKNDKNSFSFYKKKIGDFIHTITFGMRAGEKWNGINEINGGIIIVAKSGEVFLLDLIYFKHIVDKYLINNVKLDSPSFRRYRMFDIYKEDNKYFLKLNLQIRFK